jgi:hypothetical protein
LSRDELAATVCELLGWTRATGRVKTRECRDLLARLASAGLITLPAKRVGRPVGARTAVPAGAPDRGGLAGDLRDPAGAAGNAHRSGALRWGELPGGQLDRGRDDDRPRAQRPRRPRVPKRVLVYPLHCCSSGCITAFDSGHVAIPEGPQAEADPLIDHAVFDQRYRMQIEYADEADRVIQPIWISADPSLF